MATINYTESGANSVSVKTVRWEALSQTNSEGQRFQMGSHRDASVHVVGTFGSGTVVLRGSNLANPNVATAGDWVTLTDSNNAALSFTSAGLKAVTEFPLWISPLITGATGGDVDVMLNLGGAE